MIQIDVRVETQRLTQLASALSQDEIDKSIKRAINEGIRAGRVAMRRAITDDYKLAPGQVTNSSLKALNVTSFRTGGAVYADSRPESLGHFRPQSYRELQTGGFVRTFRRGKGYTSTKSTKNPSKSGVYVEILKGRKERLASAFLIFRGNQPLVMARGKYGNAGKTNDFVFGKKRLPIQKLNTKSVYWATLHPVDLNKWMPVAEQAYINELERQLNGAFRFGP